MTLNVAVVGGGIIGLATAAELMRMGADVRCYEKTGPASAQSRGMTRIFRYAHGDPRLVSLAVRARESWRALETRSARRLIGDEGLLISGSEIVPEWEAGMRAAGVPCELLSAAQALERLPVACMAEEPVLLDPSAGATRARRTVELLTVMIGKGLVLREVTAIESRDGGCTVHAGEDRWECDEVVIAAGIDSSALARQVDLDVQVQTFFHSRFTFEVRPEHRPATLSCWIDERGSIGPGYRSYCQPVGTTGRYAVGVGWEGEDPAADAVTENWESREAACAYVRQALPGLDPEPVDEIQCCSGEYDLSSHGDGFVARRRDRITAFYGANLFKFAPLIGQLLAKTAMEGEVPKDLTPLAVSP